VRPAEVVEPHRPQRRLASPQILRSLQPVIGREQMPRPALVHLTGILKLTNVRVEPRATAFMDEPGSGAN